MIPEQRFLGYLTLLYANLAGEHKLEVKWKLHPATPCPSLISYLKRFNFARSEIDHAYRIIIRIRHI
jgi:hypothetical protein